MQSNNKQGTTKAAIKDFSRKTRKAEAKGKRGTFKKAAIKEARDE